MSLSPKGWAAAALLAAVAGCAQMQMSGEPDRSLVFFNDVSAELSPEARDTIAETAKRARDTGARAIRVEGRASPTGSPEANKKLAEMRTFVVADALQQDGVGAATIRQVPIGEVRSDDPGVTDRRVDMVIER
ncbi:MAG: OmpA family protein [Alphaproteobacteria bacterium]|nr:OmpA family protein [Alphaproteobacteria bacterium]